MNPIIMPPPVDDQASALRELASEKKYATIMGKDEGMRSIAILSGKGGVGKSNLAVNIALALAEQGRRTVLIDADLGLANIDVLFGVIPKYNLSHVLRGEKDISEVLLEVSDGVSIIPGGVGLSELADLDPATQSWMIERLSALENDADVLILDTSAGINKSVLAFSIASDRTILLTTTEPTAIRDSYGVLKSLYRAMGDKMNIGIVVNMASDETEALIAAKRVCDASRQFLDFDLPYLGCIVWDEAVRDAVRKRRPLMLHSKDSPAAQSLRRLTDKILDIASTPESERGAHGLKQFLVRLAKQMTKKESRRGAD